MAAVISNYEDSGLKEHVYRQPVCLEKPDLTDSHTGQPHPPTHLPPASVSLVSGVFLSMDPH